MASPRDALERGIGMVYQEMLCFRTSPVAGNIFAGREITAGGGRLCEPEMRARTKDLLAELHLPIDPGARAESLSAAHRQLLQVARALAFDCRILVLDEPTTALTELSRAPVQARRKARREAQRHALLYVTHRLPEVFRLCDSITVMREEARRDVRQGRGHAGADRPRDGGPRSPPRAEHTAAAVPRRCSSSAGCRGGLYFHDVSLSVSAGEIVGLFGLVGSGRSELLETIFGLHAPHAGEIRIGGAPVRLRNPRQAARAGIALVPEERQRQGLFFNLSVRHNLMLPARTAEGTPAIAGADERHESDDLLAAWHIKAASRDVAPDSLSGGNQQKVVLAKWLATRPKRVLLLDEPTKGVDVGAKFEFVFHEIIRRQAAQGLACLVVSSDLPEIPGPLPSDSRHARGAHAGGSGRQPRHRGVGRMHLATAELKDAS